MRTRRTAHGTKTPRLPSKGTSHNEDKGHASACLGRADARPSQESLLPIFQDSTIPLFLLKVTHPFVTGPQAVRSPSKNRINRFR